MAILKDSFYKVNEVALEMNLYPSKWTDANVFWVEVEILFKSTDSFPTTSIRRTGQTYEELDSLNDDIRKLLEGDTDIVDFTPMEPDYNLIIKPWEGEDPADVNVFEVQCRIDASGASGRGVYSGVGPSIYFGVKKEELRKFAGKLKTELYKIKKANPYTYDFKKL